MEGGIDEPTSTIDGRGDDGRRDLDQPNLVGESEQIKRKRRRGTRNRRETRRGEEERLRQKSVNGKELGRPNYRGGEHAVH